MIKIYTFSDKRPDFIKAQKILFENFIEDTHEFIVVNAASSVSLKQKISDECKNLRINCINYPEINTHAPMPACSKPIQWCWDNYISEDNNNISFIIDSDMFIINKFNVQKYLGENDICADYDKRLHVNYIWNGLMIFSPKLKNKKELNFSEGVVDGVITDVGGNLFYYIKKYNPKIKHIENIGYIHSKNNNLHLLPQEIKYTYDDEFLCEFFEQTFFHYRAGSNWNNKSINFHNKKTAMLQELIKKSLSNDLTIPKNVDYKFHELDDWWSVDWPENISEFTRYKEGKWIL